MQGEPEPQAERKITETVINLILLGAPLVWRWWVTRKLKKMEEKISSPGPAQTGPPKNGGF